MAEFIRFEKLAPCGGLCLYILQISDVWQTLYYGEADLGHVVE